MTAARRRFARTIGADISGLDKRQARRLMRKWRPQLNRVVRMQGDPPSAR